jgi:protein TonB
MKKHIILFSLVSAALHAGLFMLVKPSPDPLAAGSPFRVSIMPAREQTAMPQDQAETTPVTTPVAQQRVQQQNVVKKVLTHATETTPPPQAVSDALLDMKTEVVASTAEASTAMSAQTTSLLRAQIEQAFRLQFYYPRLAVRQGWQGEVRLGVKLAANGMLQDIHILVSSGHGILDRAALESLGKVVQLPAATVLLRGQDLALELPVQYRLL